MALNQGSPARRMAVRLLSLRKPRFDALLNTFGGRIVTTEGTVAISATGQLDGTGLAQTLAALPSQGTYELCCHPGYNDSDLDRVTTRLRAHRDTERQGLLAEIPRALSQPNPLELVHYGALSH